MTLLLDTVGQLLELRVAHLHEVFGLITIFCCETIGACRLLIIVFSFFILYGITSLFGLVTFLSRALELHGERQASLIHAIVVITDPTEGFKHLLSLMVQRDRRGTIEFLRHNWLRPFGIDDLQFWGTDLLGI